MPTDEHQGVIEFYREIGDVAAGDRFRLDNVDDEATHAVSRVLRARQLRAGFGVPFSCSLAGLATAAGFSESVVSHRLKFLVRHGHARVVCKGVEGRSRVIVWRGWIDLKDIGPRRQSPACFSKAPVARGEAIKLAADAANDTTLSEGLPASVTAVENVNRLARVFRWLSHYHEGEKFYLSFTKMKAAIGVKHNPQAGRIASRLVRAGLVEKLSNGTAFEKGLAKRDRKSAEWRWIGPA